MPDKEQVERLLLEAEESLLNLPLKEFDIWDYRGRYQGIVQARTKKEASGFAKKYRDLYKPQVKQRKNH